MEIITEINQQFIAKQLRKPSGDFAEKIGKKMNSMNETLYDFVIDAMELNDNEKILEVGFGNGKFFNKLFSKANNLHVNGIEHSREMVISANDLNKPAVSSGMLDIELGNSENMRFKENSFDKVFCNNVIYFWKEPEKDLNEICRVLKPGGKFYSGWRSKKSSLNIPFTKFDFILYEPEDWESILKQNGFSNIITKTKLENLTEADGQSVNLKSFCCAAENTKYD